MADGNSQDRKDPEEGLKEWDGALDPVPTTERPFRESSTNFERFKDDVEEVTQIDDFSHAGYPLIELPAGLTGTLTFISGEEKGRVHTLDKAYNIIGRSQENDLQIEADTVSSRHAAIFITRALEWRIEDLGSTNGTMLNGAQVKRFGISPGDKLFIGDSLLLFEVHEDS